MISHARKVVLVIAAAFVTAAAGQTPAGSQAPAIRRAPGITAKDLYPNGCVDCHVAGKDGDMRMSALMTKWATAVPAPLVEHAKASSVDPSRIKGKHPAMSNVKANLPQTCLSVCHKKGSTQNRFLTAYQGECTHCHKLDQKTGAWKVASGAEK